MKNTAVGTDEPQTLYADDTSVVMLTKSGSMTAAAVLSIGHHESGHELGVREVKHGYTSKTAVMATGLAREEFDVSDEDVQNGSATAFDPPQLRALIRETAPDTTCQGPPEAIKLVHRYDYLGFRLHTERKLVKMDDGTVKSLHVLNPVKHLERQVG